MSGQVLVRLDPELKEKAVSLAKSEGKNLSQVVRELLAAYVKDRDMTSYVRDLWDRIGARMQESGVTEQAIAEAVARVRKEK